MSTPDAPDAPVPALTPELRHGVERWFAKRGVPQLIEGYSSEKAMDSRAAPLISLWLIVGTIKDWGTRPDWPLASNLVGIAATIAWMALVWTVVSRLRHRPVAIRPSTFDVFDIATIAFLPALPAALIDQNILEAVAAWLISASRALPFAASASAVSRPPR